MSKENNKVITPVHQDEWAFLKKFTPARIGLGRAGTSLPTSALLDFQLSHAQAMDAVHTSLDLDLLVNALTSNPRLQALLPVYRVHSKAAHRLIYLQRPDLGRELSEESIFNLQNIGGEARYDLAIVIADGLSAQAVQSHSEPFLNALFDSPLLGRLRLAPLCIAEQSRVAIGDDICMALNAKEVIVLIGERPGLSSPDSMGVYLTWQPTKGIDDAMRNCISNIRSQGLSYQQAADLCLYLIDKSIHKKCTGTRLKDIRIEDSSLDFKNKKCFMLELAHEVN
jgi:ethanolamine ammonia-lyase small subunit